MVDDTNEQAALSSRPPDENDLAALCANASLLLKMKQRSIREKDRADVYFLKNLF